jgi:hypothetical protein
MIKFGINTTELSGAAHILGMVLDVNFVLHDSDFRGGDYYRAESARGTLFLQKNFDPIDEEPFESGWPPDQIILYLDGTDDECWELTVDMLCASQIISVTKLQ